MDLQELRQNINEFIKNSMVSVVNDILTDVDDWDDAANKECGVDIYMNTVNMLSWSRELYDEWYKFVSEYSIDGDGYEIYFSTDGSGYDYWIGREEQPSLMMVVKTTMPVNITEEQFDKIINDIVKALLDYDNKETYLWRIDQKVQKEKENTFESVISKALKEEDDDEEEDNNTPVRVSVHVTDVQWDVDDEEDLKNLPTAFDLTFEHYKDEDIDEEVSNAISDKYGFTHFGFNFEVTGQDVDGIDEDVDSLCDKIDDVDAELQEIITSLKEEKELTLEQLADNGIDMTKALYACQLIYYGFYDEVKYKTPQQLITELEQANITNNYVKDRYKGAIELLKEFINDLKLPKVNENVMDDINNIEKFYAPDLKEPESLDNIWTLREWTDNLDSNDGKTLCKYTKIGLIDTINSEMESRASMENSIELLDNKISNKDLMYYLEELPTEAELVSISNYDINNLYDEPNDPKEK